MSVVQELKQELGRQAERFAHDPKSRELAAFFKDAKARGIVQEPEYTLPMMDTIGRDLYSLLHHKA